MGFTISAHTHEGHSHSAKIVDDTPQRSGSVWLFRLARIVTLSTADGGMIKQLDDYWSNNVFFIYRCHTSDNHSDRLIVIKFHWISKIINLL